jgi:putative membrane protein
MHRHLSKPIYVALLSGATLVHCSSDSAPPGQDAGIDGANPEDALVEGSSDASTGSSDAGTDSSDARIADAADAAVVLTDLQIVTILHVGNQAEIQAAQLALTRAVTTEARTFANLMVTDHTAGEAALVALFADAEAGPDANTLDAALTADGGIPFAPSVIATNLAQQASLEQQALVLKMGTSFDVSYLSDQVSIHSELLRLIDGVLTPAAQSPALRALLAQTRTVLAGHLTMALQDLAALVTGGPAD